MHNKKYDNETTFTNECPCVFVKYRNCSVTFIIITIILISIVILSRTDRILHNKSIEVKSYGREKYLIDNEGCRILETLPKSLNFFQKPQTPVCEFHGNTKTLVSSDAYSIWVDEDAMRSIGIEGNHNVTCCYYEYSTPPDSLGCTEKFKYKDVCVPFWNRTKVAAEFLKVYCIREENVIYIDFYLFTPRKEDIDIRCESSVSDRKTADSLNVLILGSDSLSRAHFHRAMKGTADYLINNLSAIEMIGYNKVSSSTYPNLLAATSGQRSHELMRNCSLRTSYLDFCKFIWDDYKLSGYRTALTEEIGYGFTLRPDKPGFCKPPTDYYSSHFLKAAITDTFKARLGKYCLGIRLRSEWYLTYVDRFVRVSNKCPYFGFFFQDSYTHERLNNGYLLDDAYLAYLKDLTHRNSFNNTVLIFFSDHGYQKHPGYMSTESGQIEAKLPLLSFVFPPWFQQKYSTAVRNMKDNARSLTTPFDFYETLKDLIDYPKKLNDSVLEKRNSSLSTYPLPRGISLFLPIPRRRTCSDADIPWQYCACNQNIKEDVRSPIVLYLCKTVIDYINVQIDQYPQCAKVSLHKIIDAAVSRSIIGNSRTNGTFGHRITFVTNPGSAVFIASALGVDNMFKENVNNSFDFIEVVSRLDIYKHQSSCVDEYKVQKFCYCSGLNLTDAV